MAVREWVVLKFGGTSVASLARWRTIASVVSDRIGEGFRPWVVCSAVSGVSDLLEKLPFEAVAGRHRPILAGVEEKHRALAAELGLSLEIIRAQLDELERLATGISLTREASPRLRAAALAQGELMSTRLGAAYLNAAQIPAEWHDARESLAAGAPTGSEARDFLQAVCPFERDEPLREKMAAGDRVIVTQGFIARGPGGGTALLGRGGSDVSAAYFAAKLGAALCEIWTDVPGMYTANPRQIPAARLLKSLDYDEAQEIASSGAKVLHPRCLSPLRIHKIPLEIRCMDRPQMAGTRIFSGASIAGAQVKAISARGGVSLVSMETVDMWHQVGFLADAFACFKRQGLSIDLVSTSETNVTVSLDRMTNALDAATVGKLVADLERLCRVTVIEPCALVSLVGRNIRGIFHQLGPALEVFEEQKIYLISQASNDLNLTFVVDEDQADRLVRELHGNLFGGRKKDELLGLSWKELEDSGKPRAVVSRRRWWRDRAAELTALAEKQSPVYVYDRATLKAALARFSAMRAPDRKFYSIKANPHPEILDAVRLAGLGFECVSIGEVEHLFRLFPDMDPKTILFTPNFVARAEYEKAIGWEVLLTVDNNYVLEKWPELFRGRDIFVRVDPGKGRGHHKYVHTAGAKSKFGVPPGEIEELQRLVKAAGTRVVGLHAHVGSSIFDAENWTATARALARVAELFPDVRILDLGGGLGVVEHPGRDPLDLDAVDASLLKIKDELPGLQLWLEPGRFIVAEAGVLLARVTQTKRKKDSLFVGIDAGMNALIRPALYGSYHEIVNLSRIDEDPAVTADIVGPICESGDTLGYSRVIAAPREGDVILVATAGAYGKVMSSNYNLRGEIPEVVL